jgi:hypothetical protein
VNGPKHDSGQPPHSTVLSVGAARSYSPGSKVPAPCTVPWSALASLTTSYSMALGRPQALHLRNGDNDSNLTGSRDT